MALVNFKIDGLTENTLTEIVSVDENQRLMITSIKIFNKGTEDTKVTLSFAGLEIYEDTVGTRETIFMDGQADVIGSNETVKIKADKSNIVVLLSGDLA